MNIRDRMSDVLRMSKKLGQVKIVGWDASPDELEGVRAGDVYALVSQDPFRMGHDGVETAVKAIRRHQQRKNEDTGVVLVTKKNLNQRRVQQMVAPTCGSR